MEKYNDFSSVTNELLQGELTRLVVEYETKNDLHIQLEYNDSAGNRYEYEMIVNKISRNVEFIKHDSINITENVNLNRLTDFEDAIITILFK